MSFSINQSNITSSGNIVGISIMGNGLTITSVSGGKYIRRSGKTITIDDDTPEVHIKSDPKAEEEDDVHVKGNHENVYVERIVGHVVVQGDVKDQLNIDSVNGNVDLDVNVGKGIHLNGTNCDVIFRGTHIIKSDVEASTVNGNIEVHQGTYFTGKFKASSVNGNIDVSRWVRFKEIDIVRMSTVNGNVKAPICLSDSDAKLKTVNGGIYYR